MTCQMQVDDCQIREDGNQILIDDRKMRVNHSHVRDKACITTFANVSRRFAIRTIDRYAPFAPFSASLPI